MKEFLEKRKVYLSRLKKTKENALKSTPEGSLHLCNRKNKAQYYWRTDPKDSSGIYIPEKDIKLARKLAQKDYDKKFLRVRKKSWKQLSVINLLIQQPV